MESEIKTCKFCQTKLKSKAIYCSHCNHYQNWRGYINFSNSFLALLIALVSVLSAFLPSLIKLLQKDKTLITCTFLENIDEGFLVLVTNEGTKRGVIAKTDIQLNFAKGEDKFEIFPLSIGLNSRIIEPQEASEITIIPSPADAGSLQYLLMHMHHVKRGTIQRADLSKNSLIITYITYNGEEKNVNLNIPEKEFEKWLDFLFPDRTIPGFYIQE